MVRKPIELQRRRRILTMRYKIDLIVERTGKWKMQSSENGHYAFSQHNKKHNFPTTKSNTPTPTKVFVGWMRKSSSSKIIAPAAFSKRGNEILECSGKVNISNLVRFSYLSLSLMFI
jgi:hypothetical protein